jgi:hypothetical protein
MRTQEKLPGRSPIPNCSKPSTLNLEVLSRQGSEKEDAPCWYGYSINSIKPWARKSPSQGPGYHNPPPLEDRRPCRSTPIQELPLLATSVCLVSSYAMPCDHSGPTCAMRHIPEPPSPHTPMKTLRIGSNTTCNTSSNPWTDGTYSWQLSRIIYRLHRPTRVFYVHFVLTHAHPRKTSRSVTHPKLLQVKHAYLGGSFEIGFRKRRCTLLVWILY